MSINHNHYLNYFSNGPNALQWLTNTTETPHYIFLDLNMPRMNGKEVLAEIKNTPLIAQIPVIVYSTSNNEFEKQECKHLGAALFVTKPYRLSDLKAVILSAFENIKPTRQTD